MKRIGLFGGTFDPIHNGHLITIQNVLEQRKLNKVFFVPCNVSPLKTNILTSGSIHRLKMVKLAIKNFPYFEVSDYEMKKGSISYTIDTILHFRKMNYDIELIIGYDNLMVFHKWHKPEEILKTAKVIVMKRHNEKNIARNKFRNKVILLDTPTIEISSTQIRNRIKNDLPIDSLVPELVKKYIIKNNLYR